MSYLDAPSTALLATHCAVCGRSLRDAMSVQLGIGAPGPSAPRTTSGPMLLSEDLVSLRSRAQRHRTEPTA